MAASSDDIPSTLGGARTSCSSSRRRSAISDNFPSTLGSGIILYLRPLALRGRAAALCVFAGLTGADSVPSALGAARISCSTLRHGAAAQRPAFSGRPGRQVREPVYQRPPSPEAARVHLCKARARIVVAWQGARGSGRVTFKQQLSATHAVQCAARSCGRRLRQYTFDPWREHRASPLQLSAPCKADERRQCTFGPLPSGTLYQGCLSSTGPVRAGLGQ